MKSFMPVMMAAVLCAVPGGTAGAFEKDVISTSGRAIWKSPSSATVPSY